MAKAEPKQPAEGGDSPKRRTGPGGARPNSGPKKGAVYRKTREKRALAEMQRAKGEIDEHGMPSSLKLIEDMMRVAAGYASFYQPRFDAAGNVVKGDEKKFAFWAEKTVEWARKLAPFKHPVLKAVLVQTDNPPPAPAPRPAGDVLDLTAKRDPGEATAAYLRLIAADPSAG